MPTDAETSVPVTSSRRAGDDLQRRVEAGGVAGGEQLLGVGRPAGAAHLLGDAHVGVEDAVVAGDVAVAAVARWRWRWRCRGCSWVEPRDGGDHAMAGAGAGADGAGRCDVAGP